MGMKANDVELVVTEGQCSERVKQHARENIADLERLAPRPVLFAQVKLSGDPNNGRPTPVLAQATLDVNGTPVRAQVAADQHDEAVDLLVGRLRTQLERLASRLESRRHEPATTPDGEWRHGALPADRPAFFPRPVDEREIVRHKTFAPEPMDAEEAVFDLQLLDHDFYLFVDRASGRDAVVHRRPDGGLGLMVDSDRVTPPQTTGALVVEARPPRLTVSAAIERLDASDEPFVFFVDADTARGRVIYRRYDGHYGLITPAQEG